MKSWILAAALLFPCGCNRYAMQDITIVNANDRLGYDVMTVCDTCKAHSKCGSRNDSLIWADDHARQTGHKNFTRQACSTGLTPVLRGAEEHSGPAPTAPAKADWSNQDADLKTGMTIDQVRTTLGDVGHTESETTGEGVFRRTLRFRQQGTGANAGSARSVLADFENNKLVATKFGPWEK